MSGEKDQSVSGNGDSDFPKKKQSVKALAKTSRSTSKVSVAKRQEKETLELEIKKAELAKTWLEADQLNADKAQSAETLAKTRSERALIDIQTLKTNAELEKTVAETHKIHAETRKADEETRNLRRWPLVFAVTALTAIAALAGVTVQYLHYRGEALKIELQIAQDKAKNEGDRTKLEQEHLELFKQQNPEMTKLYEALGAMTEKFNAAQDKIKSLEKGKPNTADQKSTSQTSNSVKPSEQKPNH